MPHHAIDHFSQARKDLDDAYDQAPRQVRQYAQTLYDILSKVSPAGPHVPYFDQHHVSEAATHFPLADNSEIYVSYQKDSIIAKRLQNGHGTPHNVKISWQQDSIEMQHYDREKQAISKQILCGQHAHRPLSIGDQLVFSDRVKSALALA